MSNKLILICLGVALVVGLVLGISVAGKSSLQSGEITNVSSEFIEGASLGDARILNVTLELKQGEQFKSTRIGPKTGGRDVEVLMTSLSTVPDPKVSGSTGTASTSMMLWAGTSTAASLTGGTGLSIQEDGGAIFATDTPLTNTTKNLPYGGLIDGLHLATGTPATTTLSSDLGVQRAGRDNASGNKQANDTDYLWVLLTSGFDQSDFYGCVSSDELFAAENNCESATSTARGFNVVARFVLRLL